MFNLNSVIEALCEKRPQPEAAMPEGALLMREHERPQPEARGVVDDPRQDHPTAPAPGPTVQPEAAELPEGVNTLVDALRELAATLPILRGP